MWCLDCQSLLCMWSIIQTLFWTVNDEFGYSFSEVFIPEYSPSPSQIVLIFRVLTRVWNIISHFIGQKKPLTLLLLDSCIGEFMGPQFLSSITFSNTHCGWSTAVSVHTWKSAPWGIRKKCTGWNRGRIALTSDEIRGTDTHPPRKSLPVWALQSSFLILQPLHLKGQKDGWKLHRVTSEIPSCLELSQRSVEKSWWRDCKY